MTDNKRHAYRSGIRAANQEDNAALLELTQLSAMKGLISLCIDRQPDFFLLLQTRGESEVVVRTEGNKILGSFSISKQEVVINNQTETVYYLADLKIHPDWRGSSIGIRLLEAMRIRLLELSADLMFCTAAEGNDRVLPFFQGRLGFPKCEHLGKFIVFQIIPSKTVPKPHFKIGNEVPNGVSLAAFYQQFYQHNYSIAPIIDQEWLATAQNLMVISEGKIVAAISLMDTGYMKQNIVKGMPAWLKLLVNCSKKLSPLMGWVPLPGIGEPIKVLNIRYWAHAPGQADALKALIQKARNIASIENFHFVSIGLHERDPIVSICKKFPNVPFLSNGYVASLQHNPEKIKAFIGGLVFEDFALV